MTLSTGLTYELNCPEFDFNLLFKTGWLNRRVESWEYVGDAQWRVRLSLDIDKNEVARYYNEYIRPSYFRGRGTTTPRIINIPILNVRKSTQFTDFSVSDKNGSPIRLLLREQSCHVAFNQLEGAVLTLHGNQSSAYKEQKLPPLSQKPELSKFLVSLFKEPLPPTGNDGKTIEFGEPGTYEKVEKYIESSIEALSYDPEWKGSSTGSLKKDFDEYWEHSRVFKYLVSLNVLRWLACVKVDLDKDDFSMVKTSFLAVRNITEEIGKSPFKRSRGSGKMSLDIDLDGVGVGEVCHVLVHAPSGTQFTPCEPKERKRQNGIGTTARKPKSESVFKIKTFFGGLLKRKTPKHRFFIKKSLLEHNKNETQVPPEAIAFGSLTPACATVKMQMGWSSNPIGNNTGSGDHLYRRIPVHDSHASVYKMCLNLAPKLGAKSLGYPAYFTLSAFVALAIFSEYLPEADNARSSASTLLLTLAPIIAAVLIGFKEEPFVSRRVFRWPSRLGKICTGVNVLVLIVTIVWGIGVLDLNVLPIEVPGLNVLNTLPLAALLNSLILLVYCCWFSWYWCRSKWTSAPNSFNVSEIPIYPDLNDDPKSTSSES